jgi:hypothetical protein
MALSDTLHTLRLRNFFTRTFVPRYQSLQNAARQTRLLVLLWAPNSPNEWAIFCKQFFKELERLGHIVLYNPQLGMSSAMRTKKGIEYKATDTIDLIVVAQRNYEPIGYVRDFEDFRVIDAKMLLFVDEAAPDQDSYHQAIREIAVRYNASETFRYPDDVTRGMLFTKILAKINVMQMVKYLALRRGTNWGLVLPPQVSYNDEHPRAFTYNLLDLYSQNRDELETMLDSTTLFILAYANHIGDITMRTLWQDMKLEAAQMQPRIDRLQRSKMLAETNGNIIVTDFGKLVLGDLGL